LYHDYERKAGGGHFARIIAISQELESRELDYLVYSPGDVSSSFLTNLTNKNKIYSNSLIHKKDYDVLIIDSYDNQALEKIKMKGFQFKKAYQLIDNDSTPLLVNGFFAVSPISAESMDKFDLKVVYGYPEVWPIFRSSLIKIEDFNLLNSDRFKIALSFGESNNEKIVNRLIESIKLIKLEADIIIFSNDLYKFKNLNNIFVYKPEFFLHLISNCNLVITGAGISMLEVINFGVQNLHVVIADNQEFQSKYYTEKLLTQKLDLNLSNEKIAIEIEKNIINYRKIPNPTKQLLSDGRQKLVDKCVELK